MTDEAARSPQLAGSTAARGCTAAARGCTAAGACTELEVAFAEVIAATVPGDVLAYGEVAAEAGYPGRGRAVGAFLARHGDGLPWWRVVTASGRLVPGNEEDHGRRLRAEGHEIRDGHVRG